METAYKLLSLTKTNILRLIKLPMEEAINIEELIRPETLLENAILENPTFRKGLLWGEPRYGHPEGKIVLHIQEVLENIENLNLDAETRRKLRLIAIVHDTFKNVEPKAYPRDWSRHHSVLAKEFLEQYSDEKDVLNVVELHDEAYYAWRMIALYGQKEKGEKRLERLLDRIGNDLPLYYLFFKCDTETGDKIQAPLKWFTKIVQEIEVSANK